MNLEKINVITHEDDTWIYGYKAYENGSDRIDWLKPKADHWVSKTTTQLLREHGFAPTFELLKSVDSMIESYMLDAWYWLAAVRDFSTETHRDKNLWFLLNNYIPTTKSLSATPVGVLVAFCEKTAGMVSGDRKEAFIRFLAGEDLDTVIKSYEKEAFDPAVLDFLEGKMTEEKMINWGIGQVMKAHPKKYDPATIKAAITQRWFS